MTTGGDSLTVTIAGKDVGLEAVLKRVDAEMQKSADQAVKLGQSYARLAQAQGKPIEATQILGRTMTTAGAASEKSLIGISTQAARLEQSGKGLQSTIAGLGGQLSQLGGTAGSVASSIGGLAGSMGALGGIGAAIGLGKVAIDLSVAGANADLVRQRFDQLAESAGMTGDALITALREASGGEISDLNLTLAANKAQLLGVADSAEEFGVLMGIARDRAQQMGISTTQAFNDLTTGLGRGSALILDNLGLIVSVKEANEKYAESLGKTAAALTEAEQKQALINQVLEQGRVSLAASGGAVESQAGTYAQFSANLANATSSLGSFMSAGLAPYAASLNDAFTVTGQFTTAIQGIPAALFPTAASAAASATALAAFDAEMQRSGDAAQAEAAYQTALAAALQQSATSAIQSAGAFDEERTAIGALQVASQAATSAHTALTTEIQGNAEAAVLAAANQQAQKVATDNLKTSTDAAVTAFLNLNPNLDAAGIAAVGAAQKIPALVIQLAQLRIAAYSARDAVAALAAQQAINAKSLAPGGVGVNAPGIRSGRNNDVDAVVKLQKANKDAADAKSDQILAIGTQQEQLNELQRQYTDAVKTGGADSASAIKAETALRKEQIAAAKAAADAAKGKGGKGGGGGVKLSDQQKLNNSLLTSQEQYAQKSEDAEDAHLGRLLDINADFAEKMLKAQQDFGMSQVEGRASFYDTLGSIEDAGLQQALSAQYEAAFQEADKIAAEKGADVGQKFLEARQAAIQAQGQRASEIAQATKDGDKDKAEYLAGVDKLYRDAEQRKLDAITSGSDTLAAERDQALADEGAKYADAQAKIGDSADTAAQRKILAAERSGKAIDVEQLKVDGLKQSYDALGAAGSRAGVTPGVTPATTPTTPPAGTTAAAAAAPPADPVVAALDAIRAAVDAAANAIVGAEKDTGSAVRGLSGKFAS